MQRPARARSLATCAVMFALAAVVILLRLLHPLPSRATANTLFVKPNGTGNACTQGSPCSLATALSNAQSGDYITLAGGSYVGSGHAVALIDRNLALIGGWDGAPTGPPAYDRTRYPTVLDGQTERRVIEMSPGSTVYLGSLRVTNGRNAFEGAGIYAQDANLTLVATEVFTNVVYSAGSSLEVTGGGMYFQRGSLRILDSTFQGNTASCVGCFTAGGGLYVEDPVTATIVNTTFSDNDAMAGAGLCVRGTGADPVPLYVEHAWFRTNGRGTVGLGPALCQHGGGVNLEWADATVTRSAFYLNRAQFQGGALESTGKLNMDRCLLTGNSAPTGAALAIWGGNAFTLTNSYLCDNDLSAPAGGACVWVSGYSTARLLHNTIVRNLSPGPYYGVAAVNNSTLWMWNNIVASQSVAVWVEPGSRARLEATLLATGPLANGADFGGGGTIDSITPEIHADPGFINAEGNEFALAPGSAAIDAGVYAKVDYDYDGDPRPMGREVDIGADEYRGAEPTPWASPTLSPVTATPTATPTMTRTPTHSATPTLTPTRGATPSPTVPAAAPGLPGLYIADGFLTPGEIRRMNPATGTEELVYRRPSDYLTCFSLAAYPRRLYYLSWNGFQILAVDDVAGVWQDEQLVYTHSTYVSDLTVVMDPDGSPVIYFSESNGAGGKIYRYAQGQVSTFYEVRQPDVASWTGHFCFGDGGDLYLSQGNVKYAHLYRVRAGRVEQIYREPDADVMGMCYASGALYYADYGRHIYRLDLSSMTRTLVDTSPTLTRLSDVELFGRQVYLPVIKRRW